MSAPQKYRKTALIEAYQWFKNGDHPDDGGGGEGRVVRYFRHPNVSGSAECSKCGIAMHDHGWIDTLEDGHNVCPGDWIATGSQGEHWPIKADVFAATYEAVSE